MPDIHSHETDGASTRSVHAGRSRRQPHHSLTTPLVQTATYTFDDTAGLIDFMEAKVWGDGMAREEYGRYGNPTTRAVEERIAALENAEDALLFASGMAAITTTLLSVLSAGTHVILTDDCYRRTRQFVWTFLKRFGIESSTVPMGDYEALEAAIQPNTRLIVSESPTNPYLRVLDLPRFVNIAQRHKIKTLVDTTFATPINVKPIDYGVDLVVHSATKYFSGHNDVLGGTIAGSAELINGLRANRGVLGGVIDPHGAWLIERGLKTLGVRVKQQNASACTIARWLQEHPAIERVWYPGLESHPDYAVAASQMNGYGGVISFEVVGACDDASRFIDALQIPVIAPSLGGVESLIEQPALMSYYDKSTEERAALGIKDNLVRFAVGIEDTKDLIDDLRQALDVLNLPLQQSVLNSNRTLVEAK
jgi:cystathionine gamma-synthase